MAPYRILVVDDEEDLCEILQFNLETEGYIVDVAYSAEEALKKNIADLLLLERLSATTEKNFSDIKDLSDVIQEFVSAD